MGFFVPTQFTRSGTDLLPVSCKLSVFCKSVFLVQISYKFKKNGNHVQYATICEGTRTWSDYLANRVDQRCSFLFQFKINLSLFMCVLFCLSFVCISAYANVYFKTTIIKQNIKIILLAGVPSCQVLPGYLITAPPSVCVPTVIGVLAVWIQHQKKKSIIFLSQERKKDGTVH